ncbi:hypothetical protein MNV49_000060 [Pseudohyphozyma bogoriensis]|nr:hypothetical protein MNV49_000060 [Pseudohyphozyma bogoriensis]
MSSPERPWRKGPLAEKADRFNELHEDAYTGDGGALKENVAMGKKSRSSVLQPHGGGMNPERARQQMEDLKARLQASHEKELARVQAKLAKTESARLEAVKEKGEAKNEVTSLRAELRSLTNKEASHKAQLDKHQALLPTLQKKLDELTRNHSESAKRKETEIERLEKELDETEGQLSAARREARKVDGLAAELGAAREVIRSEGTERGKEVEGLKEELFTAKRRNMRLERQVGDREAVVAALGDLAKVTEEELTLLRRELAEKEEELSWVWEELRWEREEKRSEKEWRQRARSDQREVTWLKEDVEFEVERGRVEEELRVAFDEVGAEVLEDERRARAVAEKDLEVAEGELDLAVNEEIPRLEEELEVAQKDVDSLKDEISDVRDELERSQEAVEVERGEKDRARGEVEEVKRTLEEKEKEVEKERTEKRRVAVLLEQSRAAKEGLKEELDIVTAELEHLQSVAERHNELVLRVDELSRLNALAENDAKAITELNVDLLSHTNASQKIRHVAALRSDLAGSQRNHLATTSKLAMAQRENDSLRAELEAYRSVSASSSSTRIRSIRPNLDDVYTPSPPPVEEAENEMPPPPLHLPGRAGLKSSAGATNGFRISLAPSPVDEDLFGIAEEEEEEGEVEEPTTTFAPSASLGGSRRAGRVSMKMPVPDAALRKSGLPRSVGGAGASRVSTGGARVSMGGAVRQQGKMSVSELIG